MAIAGSTTEPTAGAVWYGLNVQNQFASGITLPAGGPWRIYRIGCWMAGQGETARTRLCMWDSSNNLLRQGSEFTAANRSFPAPNGDSVAYEQDITDYEIAGGGTVLVGFHTHSDDNRQFPHNSGGTRKEKTVADAPISMASSTLVTGSMGVWLYYELANALPTAPTLTSPANGAVVNDLTPLLDWTHNDPDGDAQSARQIQVDNNSDFSSPLWDSTVTTSTTSATYAGSALSRGTTYYWRVRTKDAVGYGPWSATRSFKIASLPTTSVTKPSADGVAAPLYYTAGSDTTPKFTIAWSFACADGGTQSSAIVRIKDSAGTTTLHTHNVNGTATSANISGYAPTNGTIYSVSVQVTCSHGAQSTETTASARNMRARWGRASYRADLGSTPTTLSYVASTSANSGQIILEFGSTAGTTPEPTDWKLIGEVTKQRYIWHRVTLLPNPVASPTSPSLNDLTLYYSSNVLTPDDWIKSGIALLDLGTYVYGTMSLKHVEDGSGSVHVSYQTVPVVANTDYILSGRMKTQGTFVACQLQVLDSTNGVLASVDAPPDTDWTRYVTSVFNSGAETSLKVQIRTASLSASALWVDALKLEASKVVTPWTPGFLGEAVILDAGGVQVDGVGGGVFRLRASGGDVVRLTSSALEVDSAWVHLALSNSWVSYDAGSTYALPQHRKDASGYVQVRGLIKNGTTTSGIVLGNLPVGSRPGKRSIFAQPNSAGLVRIDVLPDGNIIYTSGTGYATLSNAWLSLEGIKFKAEN